MRVFLQSMFIFFAATAVPWVAASEPASPANASETALFTRYNTQVAPLITKYCAECHNATKKKGKIRLDEPLDAAKFMGDIEKWETLLEQVSTGQMPPEDKPRPDQKDVDTLVHWTTETVAWADNKRPKDAGYVLPRRLNRVEYNNTIRDLTGLTIQPADAFPIDDSGDGFDNMAAVLTMSPLLAEKYLDAAEAIVEAGFNAKPTEDKSEPGQILKERFKVAKAGVSIDDGQLNFTENGEITFSVDCTVGTEYDLKAQAWQQRGGSEDAKAAVRLDGKELATIDVAKVKISPQTISVRFKATAAKHEISLAFLNDFYDAKTKEDRNLYMNKVRMMPVSAGTPMLQSEFARRVLIATPKSAAASAPSKTPAASNTAEERAAAETILRNFAMRAFRRPVKSDEVSKLMALYDLASNPKNKGGNYTTGLKRALAAVLVSPSFLFRVQAAAGGSATARMLDDYEIASRLSYFLWSTMPDETLFKLAEAKKLSDPKIREEQVHRMLADPKSKQLSENFAGQWLELRNLDEIMLSSKRFPDWGPTMANAMRREGELLFEEIVAKDRPVLDFVNADFLYVNGPLATLYGIKDIYGPEFKRVSASGTGRGGVLTMASTLAVTSNPTRTSPVKRGKWILDQILGVPPPPPPPEVPALPDKEEDEANSPLRVRLEKHRADASCAVCHNRMDGFGFALEHYDAIGRWRDEDGKFPVEANGLIPGEDPIKGAAGLKNFVLNHKQQFMRSFAGKLLAYGIGRGMKTYDRPTLNDIVSKSAQSGYKFSSVVLAIVESDAFLKRREKKGDEK